LTSSAGSTRTLVKGSIDDHDGTCQSEHDDDALPPLARFIFEGFEVFDL
jgi:hypothetical protein